MTSRRLFQRLRALPDHVTEREMERVMLRALAPRFGIALLALVALEWLFRNYISLESASIESLLKNVGRGLICLFMTYPLIRITRMTDEEFDRVLEADSLTPF